MRRQQRITLIRLHSPIKVLKLVQHHNITLTIEK